MRSATERGRIAEAAAAAHLQRHGYRIISQNWRTRWCEIDIVACKLDVIYFIEVKYREKTEYGEGFDYITSKKLGQMSRAAEHWVLAHQWQGDYRLSAVQVSGRAFGVTGWIENIIQ